jgi:cellulose synthase (UDP-forming)
VYITRYNEPVELVRDTVRKAVGIRYPHTTYVLDDGNSRELKTVAQQEGASYICRNLEWQGHERHAKAGNINHALMKTSGQFVLVLDADQIPLPHILDRTLGYFRDPKVAFVQTPQWFYNVPEGDPLGTQAELFYGPILQSKDGWDATPFCGSNTVLRREALMQLGVTQYVKDLHRRIERTLKTATELVNEAILELGDTPNPELAHGLDQLRLAVQRAQSRLRQGDSLQEVTWEVQREVRRVSDPMVDRDLAQMEADLRELSTLEGSHFGPSVSLTAEAKAQLHSRFTTRDSTPLGSVGAIRQLVLSLDLDVWNEAQPLMPLVTNSVTEDLATSMQLHALGWRSVFHREILAVGLAPEDLGAAMRQRLRWAQGTIQILLHQNPLTLRGLTIGQRVAYLSTIWSYFYGLAAIVYLLSPVLYLFLGLLPITAYTDDLFSRFIPYFLVNQVFFTVYAWGLPRFRAQQFSMSLFPVWTKAIISAVGNVYFHRRLSFMVTPKTRTQSVSYRLVAVQLTVVALLAGSVVYGLAGLGLGWRTDALAVMVNVFWSMYNLLMLRAIVDAAFFLPAEVNNGSGLSGLAFLNHRPVPQD